MLYRHNKLFVPEVGRYGNGDCYGIVAFSAGRLVCHICPHFITKCRHINLVESEEHQANPAVKLFLARNNKQQVLV